MRQFLCQHEQNKWNLISKQGQKKVTQEKKNLTGYTTEFRIAVEQRAPGKGKAPSGWENQASKLTHLGFPGEK